MVSRKRISGMRRILPITAIVLFFISSTVNAQDFTIGASTTSDQNIFDMYTPLKDQVTNIELDISHGWNYERSYLGIFYGGNVALYRDLTARNYHVHTGVIGWFYHFPPSEDSQPAVPPPSTSLPKQTAAPEPVEQDSVEEDTTETDSSEIEGAEDDSAETESTEIDSTEMEQEKDESGTHEITTASQEIQTVPIVHSDSLDQYLTVTGIGAIQFNKEEFKQWDNSTASGIVTFRQPLGLHFSIRPSYSLIYHGYPNLSGLTNVQHEINLHLGTDIVPNSWICFTGTYGYKVYPISQSGQETVYVASPGHGKSGGTITQTVIQYDFTTPSVSQPSISTQWVYKPLVGTEITTQFLYYMNPTSTARELPTLRNGAAMGNTFVQGLSTDQNELYDDHYSFNGIELNCTWQQKLPFELDLSVGFVYQHKKYTYAAKNLIGTTIAANRIDDRTEASSTLARTFSLWMEHTLKLTGEYHYYRNGSNAELFVFDKSKFTIGMEYNF